MRRISEVQKRILENAKLSAAGKEPEFWPVGRSEHGGWVCAETTLRRHGLLDRLGNITDAGRKILAAEAAAT